VHSIRRTRASGPGGRTGNRGPARSTGGGPRATRPRDGAAEGGGTPLQVPATGATTGDLDGGSDREHERSNGRRDGNEQTDPPQGAGHRGQPVPGGRRAGPTLIGRRRRWGSKPGSPGGAGTKRSASPAKNGGGRGHARRGGSGPGRLGNAGPERGQKGADGSWRGAGSGLDNRRGYERGGRARGPCAVNEFGPPARADGHTPVRVTGTVRQRTSRGPRNRPGGNSTEIRLSRLGPGRRRRLAGRARGRRHGA